MNHNKDYYEILDIEEKASAEKIKEAYRKLAFQYHPDKNPDDIGSVERMKEINEAYAVLSEPEKRQVYDRVRNEYGSSSAHDHFRQSYSEQDIFRGSDIDQIFEEMAKSFGFRGFDEIFRSTYGQGYRTFEFCRPGMFGKFIIFGPGGSRDDGASIGRGDRGGGVIGKTAAYLLGRVFGSGTETGKDVHDTIALGALEALHGGKFKYSGSRRGREVIITVPPGIREGQSIRLRGLGDPGKHGGPSGDLYLKVEIKKPLLQRVREFLKV
ncbi:MAG TPA: DnaJ domain-containing protein [Syntrophorhabdaceae bacterium]|jgi:curved DNA-binding protein